MIWQTIPSGPRRFCKVSASRNYVVTACAGWPTTDVAAWFLTGTSVFRQGIGASAVRSEEPAFGGACGSFYSHEPGGACPKFIDQHDPSEDWQ